MAFLLSFSGCSATGLPVAFLFNTTLASHALWLGWLEDTEMIMIDIVDEYSSQPKHVGGSELGIRSYRIGAHDPAFEAARRYHQDLVQMAGRASQISKVPMGKAAAAIPAVSRIAINPGILQIARRCVEMLENLLSHLSARVSVLSRVLRKER